MLAIYSGNPQKNFSIDSRNSSNSTATFISSLIAKFNKAKNGNSTRTSI